MSDRYYLTDDERRELTAEKHELARKYEAAKSDGEAKRLWKQIGAVAEKLDDDANDRLASGWDECRRAAAAKFGPVGSTTAGGAAEIRDLFRAPDPSKGLAMQATIPLELRTEYPLLTSDSSNTFGSYAVPTSLPRLIVQSLIDESGILQAGPTIVRSTSGEAMQVPYLSTAPTATAYKPEGATATETTPVLATQAIPVFHIAGFLSCSQEFLSDAAADAEREIVKMCSQAVGKTLGAELAVGTGSGTAIEGAFVGAPTGKTAASATTFSMNELLDLRASLGSSYRGKRARWILSDAAYTHVLKLTDGEGHPLVQPAATADGFDTLWGSPVIVDSYGPALTTGKKPVLYGRADSYWLRLVGGVEVTRSDEFAFTSWKSTFRFGCRAGGMIVDESGLKALTLA